MADQHFENVAPVDTTHRCPGPKCERRVAADQLACRDHWFQVPKALRDEVWSAWRSLQRGGGDDPVEAEQRHAVACDRAIATMKEVRRG